MSLGQHDELVTAVTAAIDDELVNSSGTSRVPPPAGCRLDGLLMSPGFSEASVLRVLTYQALGVSPAVPCSLCPVCLLRPLGGHAGGHGQLQHHSQGAEAALQYAERRQRHLGKLLELMLGVCPCRYQGMGDGVENGS